MPKCANERCTNTFESTRRQRKYCCRRCGIRQNDRDFRRAHPGKRLRRAYACKHCGGTYRPSSPAQKYCSTACYYERVRMLPLERRAHDASLPVHSTNQIRNWRLPTGATLDAVAYAQAKCVECGHEQVIALDASPPPCERCR